jgi:hypothetical protein
MRRTKLGFGKEKVAVKPCKYKKFGVYFGKSMHTLDAQSMHAPI